MKKLLLFVPFILIFSFSLLYRGGISLHSHLIWAALLIIPAITLLFSKIAVMQNSRNRILMYIALALFVATFLISIRFADIQGYGIYEFFTYISGAATFFIISNISFSQKTLDKIFAWLCAIAAIIGFAGLLFYMLLAPNRVFATFVDFSMLAVSFPNAFALFLLMAIPITIYKFLNSAAENFKLYFIAGVIQIAALILTFSRESWIVAILGIALAAVILFFKTKHGKQLLIFSAKRLVPVLLIGILLAYACTMVRGLKYETSNVYEKITFQADEGKTSYTDRTSLFWNSIKSIKSGLIFGEGPGVFQERVNNHQHNLFLKIINDSGFAALVFFLGFLWILWSSAKSNYKNLPQYSKSMVLVLGASAGLVLAQNMMDYNLNFVSNSLLFWIFLGVIASVIFQKRFAFGKTEPGYKNIYAIFAALLAILLLMVSIHEGFYKIDYVKGKSLYKEGKYEDALKKFESAQSLIFKQDTPYLIGKTYYALAKEKGWEFFGTKGIDFLAQLPKNEKTMKTYILSGEFCLLSPAKDCLAWAIPSLKNTEDYIEKNLNPFKNMRIRYDYYSSLYKAGKYDNLKMLAINAEKFLAGYQNVVERNEQLTITTENPSYALKIYDVLVDLAKKTNVAHEKINSLTLAKVRLNRAISREKKKYEALYNQPAYEE
ncbi:O-antigen ligase family protein [Candidatus Peregrinibacteria bacterium]|nr:O-antigen ligase family protein [Candidatus Peregrinibacteria bacterium]